MDINKRMNAGRNNLYLSRVPPIEGRYVVFDTETTGLVSLISNVIEIGAIEVVDGKITGNQFHVYLRPRHKIDMEAEEKHHFSQDFYDKYFSDCYESDKTSLESFLSFIDDSLIFAHNAKFDMEFINNELRYWGLPAIKETRFRCTMKIFKKVVFPNSSKSNYKLSFCCTHFNLLSAKECFHSAIFDSFMTARVLCKLLEIHNETTREFKIKENSIEKFLGNKTSHSGDSQSSSSVITSETNNKSHKNVDVDKAITLDYGEILEMNQLVN